MAANHKLNFDHLCIPNFQVSGVHLESFFKVSTFSHPVDTNCLIFFGSVSLRYTSNTSLMLYLYVQNRTSDISLKVLSHIPELFTDTVARRDTREPIGRSQTAPVQLQNLFAHFVLIIGITTVILNTKVERERVLVHGMYVLGSRSEYSAE